MRRGLGAILVLVSVFLAGCGGATAARQAAATATAQRCAPYPQGTGPFTYVAIGASDAVGFGAACPDTQGYVPLLGLKMPANTKVVNLGISGATAHEALTDELPGALAAKPDIITLWLAANDFRKMENGDLTLDDYTAELSQMLTSLQSGTSAHVYVGNLPDLTKLPYFQHGTVPLSTIATQTAQWNAAIADVVAQHGDYLVDLFHSDIADHPEYIFADGFHPSTQGYAVLANAFYAAMQAHGDPKS